MSAKPSHTNVYVKLALVATIWGSTFIAGRIVSAEMSAPFAALGRFVIATAVLLILLLVIERGFPRLSARQWLLFGVLGAIGVAAYALFYMYGLQTVTASRGSLIMALIPAMTLLGGALFLHEPLTRARVAGVVLALLGVAVDLGNGNPLNLISDPIGPGEVALFGCVVAWAAYTLLGKRVMGKGTSPLAATTCSALTGTVILAIVCAFAGDLSLPQASWKGWLALGFMGVFGTAVAYVWFYDGVQAIGPARTAVFINLVPVVAITLGVLLLGEKLQASMIIGAALVVSGVWIINRVPVGSPPATAARPG
ncbi:MAG: DMT family transporter [Betaproteobacteria bacterium]